MFAFRELLNAKPPEGFVERTWTIDGVKRTALVRIPADVKGPLPADTLLARACGGEFDAVVAMYHDQGHIPTKLVAFDTTVNVSLGLPILRTSVDHGTAFDIAGRGVADPSSMVEAVLLAARLASGDLRPR